MPDEPKPSDDLLQIQELKDMVNMLVEENKGIQLQLTKVLGELVPKVPETPKPAESPAPKSAWARFWE